MESLESLESLESMEIQVLTRKDVGRFCKALLNDARQERDAEHCVDSAESCAKESRKTKDAYVKGELDTCHKVA